MNREHYAILENYFENCLKYWESVTKTDSDLDKEPYKRALEWDMIEIYKCNGGKLHDPTSPFGKELDHDTTIQFIKDRCMDLYGKSWKEHFEGYGL